MEKGGNGTPAFVECVGTTQECVVMTPLVASSIVIMLTVCVSVVIRGRVVVTALIDPNFLQWLHRIVLHLQNLLKGHVEENKFYTFSPVAKRKRILQMLFTSMIKVFIFYVYDL